MGNWNLTEEQRLKFKPVVEEYINRIEALETLENFDEEKDYLDLTFQGISPMQLKDLLEELEYTESEFDNNGWQFDFWQYMLNHNKENTYKICMYGCGMTFELKLRVIVE